MKDFSVKNIHLEKPLEGNLKKQDSFILLIQIFMMNISLLGILMGH